MPTVYRIQCQDCKKSPEVRGWQNGAVVIESKEGGVILSEGYLALRLDGDKIVALSHPLETKILEEHGYTWVSALREKRLIRVRYRACKACGTIHEEEIGAGRSGISGCFIASVGGFLIALVLHFGPGWPWPGAGTWGYVSVFAIFGINWLLARVVAFRSWRKKYSETNLRHCQRCKGEAFIGITEMKDGNACPNCGAKSLYCKTAGIS